MLALSELGNMEERQRPHSRMDLLDPDPLRFNPFVVIQKAGG